MKINKHLYTIILFIFSTFGTAMAQGQIVINEIMQSNVDFLMVDHDFPDSWVELYNASDTQINIQNYRLSPIKDASKGSRITKTAQHIEPGGHLLVYCDKTTNIPLHCNFNLEAGKGKLYLYDSSWHIVDSISYKSMPAPNVAYGRTTDGSNEWQYELTPTPGTANNSIGCDEVLPEPLFSVEGHLMNGPETITISIPWGVPEDTRIYLTLDGSEPTWESESDTLFTLIIDTSTVVRAKLLSHEMHPIRSTTHSYIFHPRATTLPFICIATDSTYLYSSEEGILSNDSTDGKPNYKYKWRRPANFEYFHTKNENTVFNQSGEVAVGGMYSRNFPQKSIKCYAKNRFGKKFFKGNFWRDKPDVNKVKSFMLRNGGSTCKYARIDDAFVNKLFGTHLEDIDWQAYEPVIVYINGQYKGIFGMRERSNEDFVTSNYDIEEEEVEIADGSNYKSDNKTDSPHFNSFHKLYHRNDVTYEELAEAMDVENFMNVFIAECYASNTDYPANNVSMWKQTTEDGRWHWISKDLDYIFINTSSWDMFKYMFGTQNSEDQEYERSNNSSVRTACKLYEKMMSFPEFRNRFISTYANYLGDFLRPDICVPIIQEMDGEIIDEIAPTFAAYEGMPKPSSHTHGMNRLYTYVSTRPPIVYRQMASYFSLGDVIPVSIREELPEGTETIDTNITVCDVPLRTGRFDGAWFTSFPLFLYTKAEDAAWVMNVFHADGSSSSEAFYMSQIQPDLTSCIPGDSISFVATTANIADNIQTRHSNCTVAAIYDATGKRLPAMQKGLNLVLYSDGTRRKLFNAK